MNNYYKFILKSGEENLLVSLYLLFRLFFYRKLNFLDKKYYKKFIKNNGENKIFKINGIFSEDWFSYNVKYLARTFYKYKFENKNLNILEIGSYEGLSTVFFLTIFKNSKITCIDPFEDFEENKDKDFNIIYKNFINNTSVYKDRINLFKGTSDNFFKLPEKNFYDLIYIDGNHNSKFVLRDAENSFNCLNKGGIIIFDDFLWNYYDRINENPIGGIKKFIKKNFFKIKIISISYQIVIMKI